MSTYTANLAAFFTVNNAVTPINNIEDAAKSDYDIGVTKGTNLYSFFRSAEYELYRGIWYKMEAKNSLPNSTINGIHWVRTKSKYIHMSDGPILKYAASRKPCNLVTSKLVFFILICSAYFILMVRVYMFDSICAYIIVAI